MKKIEAIIRPSKLKAIQQGLKDVDIPCLTVFTGLWNWTSKKFY